MASQSRGGDQGQNELMAVGEVLLKDFIFEEVNRHFDNVVLTREQLGGAEICDPTLTNLSQCLQKIAKELDVNEELQRLISDSSKYPMKAIFMKVAMDMLSDGKFTWGKVVTLFYLASRLVIKALVTKALDMISSVINWTLDYIRNHLISWIRDQGGWEGIPAYFSSATWPTVGTILAGFLATILVIRKMF